MKIILNSIPEVIFAHTYSAERYSNYLNKDENTLEISYIKEGALELETGGKRLTAQKGSIITLLSGQSCNIFSNAHHEHHTIGVSVKYTFEKKEGIGIELPLLLSGGAKNAEAAGIIDKIIMNFTLNPQQKCLCGGLIMLLFNELNALAQAIATEQGEVNFGNWNYVERAKSYIYKNISRPVTQTEIARYLNISTNYLCSVFKQITGKPVIRYINEIKLDKIKHLVANNNIKLFEACQNYGYSDANYVSKLFKKYYGQTISQYVKSNRTEISL